MRMFGRRQFARRSAASPRVVAVGSFDGVHLGHRRLVSLAKERAETIGGEVVVLTFWPLPGITLGRRGSARLLSTPARRAGLLADLGVDHLVTLHFHGDLATMEPETFVEDILVGDLAVDEICVGFNFTFGSLGSGDPRLLCELGSHHGFSVRVLDPVEISGQRVSSTIIRELIGRGEVAGAAALLGRPHLVEGHVVRGRGRGRQLGFPTANVQIRGDLMVPGPGVYIVDVTSTRWNSNRARAVANIGGSPTFDEPGGTAPLAEVYVPGFEGDLYGERLGIEFLRKIRDLEDFSSPDGLVREISRDVKIALATGDPAGHGVCDAHRRCAKIR